MPNFWVLYTLYFRNDRAQQSELIIFTLCVCVFFLWYKIMANLLKSFDVLK